MEDEFVVYRKRHGEEKVPLTVRIDWLPDGTIIPRMYWTPDGACYKILTPPESVPLSFLKDRGEGLRFDTKAELIEMPDCDDTMLHTQYESYLYLAYNLFSQRNIVDERYDHSGKEFIPVTLDVFPDGGYEIIYFWCKGLRYMVEKTIAVEPRGSYHAGGMGIWHKVNVRLVNAEDDEDPDPNITVCRLAALFLELNKWFVSIANTS